MTAPRVQIVKATPKLTRPIFAYGIPTEKAAREWAMKHGYAVVYWLKAKQRAYAERVA